MKKLLSIVDVNRAVLFTLRPKFFELQLTTYQASVSWKSNLYCSKRLA